MYNILNFFKIMIEFAYDFMNIPISIYGVDFTIWSVFMFVLIGGILWWAILKFYDND